MAKKTISVDSVLDFANTQLKRTDEFADAGFKYGIITMIEKILHETGNYQGYTFANPNDSEYNTPGWFNRKYLK